MSIGTINQVLILLLNPYQNYQFWTKAQDDGYFSITNIRASDYNLYAWVPGFIGDYRYDVVLNIIEGINELVLHCFYILLPFTGNFVMLFFQI